jgi:hypothetical protein
MTIKRMCDGSMSAIDTSMSLKTLGQHKENVVAIASVTLCRKSFATVSLDQCAEHLTETLRLVSQAPSRYPWIDLDVSWAES